MLRQIAVCGFLASNGALAMDIVESLEVNERAANIIDGIRNKDTTVQEIKKQMQKNFNVNLVVDGRTPLHFAIEEKSDLAKGIL